MNIYNLIPFIPVLGIPLYFIFEDKISLNLTTWDSYWEHNNITVTGYIVAFWQIVLTISIIKCNG